MADLILRDGAGADTSSGPVNLFVPRPTHQDSVVETAPVSPVKKFIPHPISNPGISGETVISILEGVALCVAIAVSIVAYKGKMKWLNDALVKTFQDPLMTGVIGAVAFSCVGGLLTLNSHLKKYPTSCDRKTFLPRFLHELLDGRKKVLLAIALIVGVGLLVRASISNGKNSFYDVMSNSFSYLNNGAKSFLNSPIATGIAGSVVSMVFWRKLCVHNYNRKFGYVET